MAAKSFKAVLVEMFLDDPVVQKYECLFVPDSLRLTSKNGAIYNVSVQFSVKPLKVNEAADDAIVMLVNNSISGIADPLEKLVNDDLPEALENLDA